MSPERTNKDNPKNFLTAVPRRLDLEPHIMFCIPMKHVLNNPVTLHKDPLLSYCDPLVWIRELSQLIEEHLERMAVHYREVETEKVRCYNFEKKNTKKINDQERIEGKKSRSQKLLTNSRIYFWGYYSNMRSCELAIYDEQPQSIASWRQFPK